MWQIIYECNNQFFDSAWVWLSINWQNVALLLIGIGIVYVAYLSLSKEIRTLKNKQKLEENVAFNLNRGLKWLSILIIFGIIVAQFGFDFGLVAGFMALAGGTIIGFASMSTLGNAIAGIIVMVSKPFRIGDRILFGNNFADVIAIDLIYTRLKTLDNVLISIPNQQLLTSEIDNFGKKNVVRRGCSVTVGYDTSFEVVEKALLEASKKVEGILNEPKSYVWTSNLLNFSVEYTLFVFTNQIRRLPVIDATLKKTVLHVCKEHKVDQSTPNLLQAVGKNKQIISD
jgi:small-conductance mechanosensitive channel